MALNMNAAVKIKASVDGLSQISGLQKSLGGVESQSNRTGGALGRLRGMAGGAMNALRAIAPAASIAGLVLLGKRTLDAADALSKMSQRTGIAVPELAKFQKAAELSDVSMENVGKSLGLLSKGMAAAQNGTGPAAAAFQQLGIKVTDANGKLRSSGDVMTDIAERFKNMPDGAEKAAVAMQLFGRSGMDLIPMLNMGSEAIGKLGTNMTQEFADKAAAFNDRITTMQGKMGDLATRITIALLPAFEAVIGLVERVLDAFINLPGPIQAIIGIVGALGVAFIALAPAFAALAGIGAVFTGINAAIVAANIGGLIAGWLPVFAQIIPAVIAIGKVVLAVFSGPVGWVALAVAAGVAIYTFRDQIGEVFKVIGNTLTQAAQGFKTVFIDPVANGIEALIQGIQSAFSKVKDILTAPFTAAFNAIRGVINQILNGMSAAINGVIGAINKVIQGANRALAQLNLPQIPTIPSATLPRFADGGVVKRPTIAMVGEGGEPEYIIPESKMAATAQNYLAGQRGAGAIQSGTTSGPTINVTTGPVVEFNGERYVTMADFEQGLQQVAGNVFKGLRTPAGRYAMGVRNG